MTEISIGVDVSKDTLDAHRYPGGDEHRFTNDPIGHQALTSWIGTEVSRVVFEPTGPYHGALERALAKAGVPIVKVNPRNARNFAKAAGKLAKTDQQDAALLARMGAMLQLEPRPGCSESFAELKQLHIAREALVKDRTAAKNREKTITLSLLKRQNAERLKQIEEQIARVEAEIMARIKADANLAHRFEIVTSIPGIAHLTAFVLLIGMPELGTMEPGQAASLAGLAPMARQSGKWTGKAFIQGGRNKVRHALFMPALSAIRFNADMKAKYEQLIKAGKPPKVALVAIMRKLVLLANALLKADRLWQKEKPCPSRIL